MISGGFKRLTALVLTLIFVFSFTSDAHAYLDPGTGSVLFQFLIAGILGFLFTIKTYLGKIKNFITGIGRKNSTNDH